ncbi:MAG: hypothetical protein CL608_15895 [Anaerolineaceae bacterium]|nr:hypothetical protein [Anaerolineaceae bacterium]
MTTHRVPQRRQHGRSSSLWERVLLVILIVLFLVLAGLVAWQIRDAIVPAPLPTLVPSATPVDIVAEPLVQIAPATGVQGTLITVQGEGWPAGEQLIVCLDDLGDDAEPPIYAQAVVNGAGEFSAAFTFPVGVQWRSLPDIPIVVASTTSQEKQSAIFKLVENTPTSVPATAVPATATPVPPSATPVCTYSMRFVTDVSIADDTAVPPGAGFMKTWRIQNNGTCTWPAGTSWVFAGGSQMGGPDAVPVAVTNPGETADVSVYLVAPTAPGRYIGYWTLRLPSGVSVNQRYFVRIVVPAPSPTATPVTPTPTPVPITPTPVIYNWRGEYFSNATLAGTPTLVRDDTAVNFNWQSGAPAANLPADYFSARWQRSLYFEGGSYRFYATGDDGLRLWIDNALILDEWHGATSETYTAEVTLSSGNHALLVEYYEATGLASIQLWWQRLENYPDWRGEYWNNATLAGPSTVVRNDTAVLFNWGAGAPASGLPADNFSARWTRTLYLPEGNYRFHAAMDDGLRLYVDNTLLIDEWRDASYREVTAELWLAAGNHQLRVEYYEHLGDARVQVWWDTATEFTHWRGEYWDNKNLTGTPVLVRNDHKIEFDWGNDAPAPGLPVDQFSVRWTRVIEFEPDTYILFARADDGVRIYVDGNKVLDRWQLSGGDRIYQKELELQGTHTIVVEYYDEFIAAEIHFWYEPSGGE